MNEIKNKQIDIENVQVYNYAKIDKNNLEMIFKFKKL